MPVSGNASECGVQKLMSDNAKRKEKTGNRALLDVDQRIVVALAERDEASRKVSLLVYWQDRLNRITQDIEMLISIQQRLSGKVPDQPTMTLSQAVPIGVGAVGAIPYSHTAVIPQNISSVPRQPNPQPSGANVAEEVGGEGGFS